MTFEAHQIIVVIACYLVGFLVGYAIYKTVKDIIQ